MRCIQKSEIPDNNEVASETWRCHKAANLEKREGSDLGAQLSCEGVIKLNSKGEWPKNKLSFPF